MPVFERRALLLRKVRLGACVAAAAGFVFWGVMCVCVCVCVPQLQLCGITFDGPDRPADVEAREWKRDALLELVECVCTCGYGFVV